MNAGGGMRGSVFNFLVLGLVITVLSGCDNVYRWHQKITVEVETPEGLQRGSTVQAIQLNVAAKWMPKTDGARSVANVRGEAVVLELAPRKYLFVLLTGSGRYGDAEDLAAYTLHGLGASRTDEVIRSVTSYPLGLAKSVPRKSYPLMVTFEDITDPTSVKQVDPSYLAGTFGPGYKLKSITLEITDEPVTEGKVEAVLPKEFFKSWGMVHKAALQRGVNDPYFDSLPAKLSRNDFYGDRP